MRAEVAKKLYQIQVRGNIIGGLVNIIVSSVTTYYQVGALSTNTHWPYAYGLVSIGALLRIASSFFDKNFSHLLSVIAAFLLGLGWGAYFIVITSVFGLGSVETSYMLLILAGVVNAAGVSYRSHHIQYYTFVSVLGLIILGGYIFSNDSSYRYIVLFVLSFYVLNVFIFRMSSKQLRESVEGEVSAWHEKQRLKRLIDAVPGYVSILDEKLIYQDANKLTLNFYPDLIGKKLGVLGIFPEYANLIEDFSKSDKEIETKELKTSSGDVSYTFLMSLQKTYKNEIVVVAMPLDELVKAREELRIQEAKALYSAKLASLGEMAASIAHEVNNPLTIIQGSASIIQRLVETEPLDKENIKVLSQKMVDTTARISKTIKSLKSLSRSGENDPIQMISLQTVIEECLEICRHRFIQNETELKLPDFTEEIKLSGREIQMGQVFLNLFNNSLDAVSSLPQNERWVEVRVTKASDFLCIDVIDSGKGIAEKNLPRIMEPFFTTKEIGQGTGLGLSISKNLIREQGGELMILEKAKHTTFRIQLPL